MPGQEETYLRKFKYSISLSQPISLTEHKAETPFLLLVNFFFFFFKEAGKSGHLNGMKTDFFPLKCSSLLITRYDSRYRKYISVRTRYCDSHHAC